MHKFKVRFGRFVLIFAMQFIIKRKGTFIEMLLNFSRLGIMIALKAKIELYKKTYENNSAFKDIQNLLINI